MANFPIVVDVMIKGLDQIKRLVGATDEAASAFDHAGEAADGAAKEFKGAGRASEEAGKKIKGAGDDAKGAGIDLERTATQFRAMGSAGTLAGDTIERFSIITSGPLGLAVGGAVIGLGALAVGFKAVEGAATLVVKALAKTVEENDLLTVSVDALNEELTNLQVAFGTALMGNVENGAAKIGAFTLKIREATQFIEKHADTIHGAFVTAVKAAVAVQQLQLDVHFPLVASMQVQTRAIRMLAKIYEAFRGRLVEALMAVGDLQVEIYKIIAAKLRLIEAAKMARAILAALVNTGIERFKALTTSVKKSSSGIFEDFKTFLAGIAAGVSGVFNGVKRAVMQVLGPAINKVSEAFKKLGEIIASVGKAVAEALGLDQMAAQAKDALAKLKGIAVGFGGDIADITSESLTAGIMEGYRAAKQNLADLGTFLTTPGAGAFVIKPPKEPTGAAPAPGSGIIDPSQVQRDSARMAGFFASGAEFAAQTGAGLAQKRREDLARVRAEEDAERQRRLDKAIADAKALEEQAQQMGGTFFKVVATLQETMTQGFEIAKSSLAAATGEVANFFGAFAAGESTLSEFGDAMADLAANIANTFGDLFIKQGIGLALFNPGVGAALIAAGFALKMLGGAVASKGSANRGTGASTGSGASGAAASQAVAREVTRSLRPSGPGGENVTNIEVVIGGRSITPEMVAIVDDIARQRRSRYLGRRMGAF